MKFWRGPPHGEIQRCGAHAKGRQAPCMQYAMKNGRCRWHGGKSTGAKSPHRPVKHGERTKQAEQDRREIASLMNAAKKLIAQI
jgi:hypothetical protein